MFNRIGKTAVRHPWLTIAAWVAVGVALAFIAQMKIYDVTTSDQKDQLSSSYESVRAAELAEDAYGKEEGTTSVTALVKRGDGSPIAAADRAEIERLAAGMSRFRPDWDEIEKDVPFLSDKRKDVGVSSATVSPPTDELTLVAFDYKGNPTDPAATEAFKQLRDETRSAFADQGLVISFTGGIAAWSDDFDEAEDTKMFETALLLGGAALLMLLFFRGILAAVVPIAAVYIVGGAAGGLVVLAASAFDFKLESTTPTLITVVLTGIGIDYFLFLVFRYRERLRAGEERRPAALHAVGKVGVVIASAALAVVIAFATLVLAEFGQFQMLGPAIAISVLVMLLAGVTLFPAILAVSGRAMFWPSKSWRRPEREGFAARLGAFIARRPMVTAVAATALLVVLSLGALRANLAFDPGGNEANTESSRVADEIAATMPRGAVHPVEVYVRGDEPLTATSLQRLERRLGSLDGVGSVSEPALADDGRVARVDLALNYEMDSDEAMNLVSGPIRELAPSLVPPGAEVLVGGASAVYVDLDKSVTRDLRVIFPIAAILILLILVLLLRSVVAPAYMLAVVGLEFVATLGAAVLVFQDWLGRDGVAFSLPIVLYLFVVALGTDYNMLIASRLREETEAGRSIQEATANAVRYAVPAIAAAGLVLATSFGSLMFNPNESQRQMGFSMAVGILLASFVVSALLVPAITRMVGARAWWPGRTVEARGPVATGRHAPESA